jgi:sterol desaturase/sphingolipid hydroxylase (fatty acid hydroxylase superfamily)
MTEFLNFFEFMPAWQKLAWVIGCLAFFWILEGNYPLFRFGYKKWRHAKTNLILLSFTIIINFLFGLLTVGIFVWTRDTQFGLLYLVNLPVWVELILALMFFDLIAQYVVHYLLHRVKWMWKLHMIHHSDTKVDATTGTRHHPGDYVLRETFSLFAILILGSPVAYYLFYRICTVFFTYISHANISMPLWLDRSLSLIFITPNMHKFHHHFERPWTDTNFGNIFSLWDRMFGTMVYDDPRKIRYGLDVLEGKNDEDLRYQLRIPLDKTIKTDY